MRACFGLPCGPLGSGLYPNRGLLLLQILGSGQQIQVALFQSLEIAKHRLFADDRASDSAHFAFIDVALALFGHRFVTKGIPRIGICNR